MLILVCLITICFSAYNAHFQISENGFINNFDDNVYILENSHVKEGLTKQNIYWALTSTDNGFWHPLTWLSLMYDANGQPKDRPLDAKPFHTTALWLHILNSGLLFILFLMMSTYSCDKNENIVGFSKIISSFLAALIFAVHPVHVESIAWASQRKDLLCFLFLILTLMFYFIYTNLKESFLKKFIWFLVITMFIFCTASKSSAVLIPITLILLDILIFKNKRAFNFSICNTINIKHWPIRGNNKACFLIYLFNFLI